MSYFHARQPSRKRSHKLGKVAQSRHRRALRPLRFEPLEQRSLLAVITVNSLADNTTASNGIVTLRDAIDACNYGFPVDGIKSPPGVTFGGPNIIEFAPTLFSGGATTLDLTYATTSAKGLADPNVPTGGATDPENFGESALWINSNITIIGYDPAYPAPVVGNPSAYAGDGALTLDAKPTTAGDKFRLFSVAPGATLTLDYLTITGGVAEGGSGDQFYTNTAVNVNTTPLAGEGGNAGMGGAIINEGTLNINNCTFTNNTAQGGKGVATTGSNPAQLPNTNQNYDNPQTPGAQGFDNGGLPGQYGNNVGAFGGLGGFGAGGGGGGGGGVTSQGGKVFGGGSEFGGGTGGQGQASSDGGGGGGAGMGGAIFNQTGDVNIVDSTFAGNKAIGGAGSGPGAPQAGDGLGGAIFNLADSQSVGVLPANLGTVTILNSTLAYNTAAQGGGEIYNHAEGDAATVNLANDILSNSGNNVTDYDASISAFFAGTIPTTGTNNLIFNNSSANPYIPTGLLVATITGQDPLLSPASAVPGANGGPTATYVLGKGSPAIGAGAVAPGLPLVAMPAYDQRGYVDTWTNPAVPTTVFPRIVGVGAARAVDLGATEIQQPIVGVGPNGPVVTGGTGKVSAAGLLTDTDNEGTLTTVAGVFTDPDVGETLTITSNVGTVTKGGTNAAGTWTWTDTPSTVVGAPGQQVTITVTSSSGLAGVYTFDLVVLNIAPVLVWTNPIPSSAIPSSTDTFTFKVTDPGLLGTPAETITMTPAPATSGGAVGVISNFTLTPVAGTDTETGSFQVTFSGPANPDTITLVVQDNFGAKSNALQTAVIVGNVVAGSPPQFPTPPTSAAVVINEGQTATNSGTFSGSSNVVVTASIGTISPPTSGFAGSWNWSYPTGAINPPLNQTVTITATDAIGQTATETFTVTVNPVAPVVTLSGPSLSPAAGTQQYTFTTFEPGLQTFTLVSESGGANGIISNAQFNPATGTGSFNVQFGGSTTTTLSSVVSVQVADSNGLQSNLATIPVTIAEGVPPLFPPTVTANNATITANVGQNATNTGTFNDVNSGDTVTLTANVGTITQSSTGQSGTWSWSMPVSNVNQAQTVTITATDSSQKTASTTFVLNVTNTPPTVTISGPATGFEGQTNTYSFTTSGPSGSTYTVVAASGGAVGTVSNVSINQGTGSGSFSVKFNSGNPADAVSIQIQNSAGLTSNVATIPVNVASVPPNVILLGPTSVTSGQFGHFTFTAMDAGTNTFTVATPNGGTSGIVSNLVFNQTTGVGSFDVKFFGGATTTDITVQVTDSAGTVSNLATLPVAVAASSTPPPPFQNPNNPLSVSGNSVVSAIDVLDIINELNDPRYSGPGGILPTTYVAGEPYLDVDGDGYVTAADALLVIDYLDSQASPGVVPAAVAAVASPSTTPASTTQSTDKAFAQLGLSTFAPSAATPPLVVSTPAASAGSNLYNYKNPNAPHPGSLDEFFTQLGGTK